MLVWCWSLNNDPVCLLSCDTKLQVSARGLEGKAAPEQSLKLVTYYCCHPFDYSPYCATTTSLPWSSHVNFPSARSLLPMQMNGKCWFLICSHFKSLCTRFLQLWGTQFYKSRAMCWAGCHLKLIFPSWLLSQSSHTDSTEVDNDLSHNQCTESLCLVCFFLMWIEKFWSIVAACKAL